LDSRPAWFNIFNKLTNKIFLRMKKLYFFGAIFLLFVMNLEAQVTGIKNIPGDYATLALAITDLNTVGVGAGGATINVLPSNPQTAPAGGYVVGGTGSVLLTTLSSSNPLSFVGNGNTITAFSPQVAGAYNDAIVKIVGSDFVSISGFTLQENPGNTVVAAGATNTMTEWGIALLYANTTNSPQNITITGNTISLNRLYALSYGIYANATHSITAPTTSASATTASGSMSNLLIQTNIIGNVNNGIVVVGPTAAADYNNMVKIGGALASQGNTIINYGNINPTTGLGANVSGTINGVLVRNSTSVTIQNNNLTIPTGNIGTTGTAYGIHMPSSTVASIGAFVNVVSNNTVSLNSGGTTATLNGILIAANSASPLATLRMESNNCSDFSYTNAAPTGFTTFYSMTAPFLKAYLGNNNANFLANSLLSTGGVTFMSHSNTMPANGLDSIYNNTLLGFNKAGAGGTITGFTSSSSSPNTAHTFIVNNNIIGITTSNTTASSTSFVGITSSDGAGSSPVKVYKNNNFSSINLGINTGSITGISVSYLQGAGTSTNAMLQTYSEISGNILTNYITNGSILGINLGSSFGSTSGGKVEVFSNQIVSYIVNSATGSINGILASNTSFDLNIYNHELNAFSANSSGAVNGISITGSTKTNVFKNKIYGLTNLNANPVVNGIVSSSGTLSNIYNNIIGDLGTPAANASNPLSGINISGGTTANISYNTVRLSGTSTGALFGSSAFNATTSTTVDLKNNIFVNSTTPVGATGFAAAHRRSGTAITTFATASNGNDYYAGTPGVNNLIFYDGTNSDQTIAAYKARMSPREANSISDNPTFTSITGFNSDYLHINTTVPTQIESGGVSIPAILDDFEGDNRNTLSPDMGADEFSGVGVDLTAPAITFTPLPFTCDGTLNRSLIASITDGSFVPTSGPGLPVLYWKINQGSWIASTGTPVTQTSFDFSFGIGATLGDSVSYYIVAQDMATSPNVGASPSGGASGFTASPPAAGTPPTNPIKYFIRPSLNGTYTVGSGGDFTTLTAAVAAYNNFCLSGPVVFSLIDANYATNETFPIVINSNSFSNLTNTLTIKPATGVTSSIIGTAASGGLIRLNGADNVIVDGSNNGTDSRNLTITNTSTTAPSAVVMSSLGLGAGSTNNVVKNLILNTGISTNASYGIALGGSTPGTEGADNDNNTITNNIITGVTTGIYAKGTTANSAGANDNLLINKNNITTQTTIATIGIQIGNSLTSNISKNTVSVESSVSGQPVAISLEIGFLSSVVDANTISKALSTATGGYAGRGIVVATGSPSSNVTISNNFVSGVNGSNWSTFGNSSSIGIAIGVLGNSTTINTVTGGVNLYYNTVNMTGGMGTGSTTAITTALYVGSGATALDIRNNILANTQTATNATQKNFAIYSAAPSTTFLNINFNDYYVSNSFNAASAILGNINISATQTDQNTLALLQSSFGGNTNSLNVAPVFALTTSSDLHLVPASNLALNNTGTPVASVTMDYDMDNRDASTPDLGGDEFIVNSCVGQPAVGVISPSTITKCGNETYTMSVTGETIGIGISYQWKVGPVGGPYTNVTGGVGATTNSYTTAPLTAGIYEYIFETTCAVSSLTSMSNTLIMTVNAAPMVACTPTSGSLCFPGGTPVALTASGASTYAWSPSLGLSSSTGATVSASPSSTITYTVTGTDANGCTNTAQTVITSNLGVGLTATANPSDICANDTSRLIANAVSASIANSIKLSEITLFKTGTGATPTYPSYIGTLDQDFAEISNLSSSAIDVSNLVFEVYTGTTLYNTFTIPAGTIIPGNQILTFHIGTAGTANPAARYLLTGAPNDGLFSSGAAGFVLKNAGTVIDAVVTNGYVFPAASGVLTSDWTGTMPSSSGLAGIRRTGTTDTNDAADWTISGATNLQNIGTYNGGYITTGVGTFTYLWSPTTYMSSGAETTFNPKLTSVAATTIYNVLVTSSNGCTANQNVTVTVSPGAAIITQPTDVTRCAGLNAVFTVSATGPGLTYQWKKDGVDILSTSNATATTPNLTLPTIAVTDAGSYSVLVTSTCGTPVTSNAVTLTVVNGITATVTPGNSLNICTTQTLTSSTNATSPIYQWRRNGEDIPLATANIYNASQSGIFTVKIIDTGSLCEAISSNDTLKLLPTPGLITVTPSAPSICGSDAIQILATVTPVLNAELLKEDFNGSVPGWTAINNSTGGTPAAAAWTLYASSAVVSSPDNSDFILSNSDAQGVGSQTRTILNSPTFDLSSYTTCDLKFDNRFRYNSAPDSGRVQVSLDGITWNTVALYNSEIGTDLVWVPTTLNLNAYAGMSGVRVRFKFDSPYGYYWGIDNVVISGTYSPKVVWSPSTNLYTDAAATIPYVAGSLTNSVYAKPASTTTYSVTAGTACTSTTNVTVTVGATPAPTGSVAQSFCLATAPTLANVVVTPLMGGTIKWYDLASGGMELPTSTVLVNNAHYFAAQVVGGCESAMRLDVMVALIPTPATPTGSAVQTFCASASPTVASLVVTPSVGITWYDAATMGAVIAPTTALVNGNHYFASQSVSGCESARLDVTAAIEGSVVTTGANSGAGSLRSVVACAMEGSTVTIDPAVTSIIMTESLMLDKNLMITDPTMAAIAMITFDFATATPYGINIVSGKMVTLENLALTAINNPMNLPLIQVDGDLTAKNVTTNQ
jgi:hypothetical protein